jgi:hypothetical protein
MVSLVTSVPVYLGVRRRLFRDRKDGQLADGERWIVWISGGQGEKRNTLRPRSLPFWVVSMSGPFVIGVRMLIHLSIFSISLSPLSSVEEVTPKPRYITSSSLSPFLDTRSPISLNYYRRAIIKEKKRKRC